MQGSKLASQIRKGDRRALAKGITLVESGSSQAADLLRQVKPPRHAFVVGVTGPPGTGKSSLVDRMIRAYRKEGMKVGVVAVDPSSPFTGGALLGDRIRMVDHASDANVYIRSMASRGWSGGLSRAASQAVQLMDAAGFDVVFIETVGIGQSDIEVVGISHAVVVVLMPGLGDDIQVSKAGLMEVGDVYVVNKSDLEGADPLVVSLLGMAKGVRGRSPAVLKASAVSGEGIDKLTSVLESMRAKLQSGDSGLELKSIKGMIVETARGDMLQDLGKVSDNEAERLARKVLAGKLTVTEAAQRLSKS